MMTIVRDDLYPNLTSTLGIFPSARAYEGLIRGQQWLVPLTESLRHWWYVPVSLATRVSD